jgi:hypothetical protein
VCCCYPVLSGVSRRKREPCRFVCNEFVGTLLHIVLRATKEVALTLGFTACQYDAKVTSEEFQNITPQIPL